MSELVSILMPVKNGSKYLYDCIQSIVNQIYQNWELIAIDDHSSDDSWPIIQDFSLKDSRIKLIKNSGHGIPKAIQTGLIISKGSFVTRMDCDDLMDEKKIELMSDKLVKGKKRSVVVSLVKYFSDNELGDGYRKYEKWINELSLSEEGFKEIYRECVIPSPSWMLRKTDIDNDKLLVGNTLPEDYNFCFKLYQHNYKILCVQKQLHLWRDHNKRLSRNDSNYDIRKFGPFKLSWFIKNEVEEKDELVLWGSGKKGKEMAQFLLLKEVSFTWISGNKRKIGLQIYNKTVDAPEKIIEIKQPKIVIAVSSPKDKRRIEEQLKSMNLRHRKDYFFFF